MKVLFRVCVGVLVFAVIAGVGVAAVKREGRDLNVGLFGVVQSFSGRSPYENPTDPSRPVFRYAPGFAILEAMFLQSSRQSGVSPFYFYKKDPSIVFWYLFEIACLLGIAFVLPKLIPSKRPTVTISLSFLLALPYIIYELVNCQNKIPALFFMLLAVLLFERKSVFVPALAFCVALTIYIPLIFFLAYFLIEAGGRYISRFLLAAFIVFLGIPALVWGPGFSFYLLGEWFDRCIRPFAAGGFADYVDIRNSSMSLPSALAKLFVFKNVHRNFEFIIRPSVLDAVVRVFCAALVAITLFAAWMRRNAGSKGLVYACFLMLALLIPQYCIYYTWSWMIVFYFAVLSYGDFATPRLRSFALSLAIQLCVISLLMFIPVAKFFSLLSWSTILLLFGAAFIVMGEPRRRRKLAAPVTPKNISVVLIARNEEENIGNMITGIIGLYGRAIMEIIVVDDSSNDGTVAVVKSLSRNEPRIALVRLKPPNGVGRAIKAGFEHVSEKADYVLSMDSDFAQSLKSVEQMISHLETHGCDGVIGSRFIPGSVLRRYPGTKKAMNRIFHFIVRALFRIRVHDLTNNFKLYRRQIVKTVPWRSNGFSINAETGILPILYGFRIEEVPVSWIGRDSRMGKSKFRLFTQGWGYLKVLASARRRDATRPHECW
jgi:hypothetical protein